MADNTTINAGSGGDVIATDDISGVKYPRSKITIGADGTNDGDVSSSNPMPVRSKIVTATTSFTRPANTTAYAENDAISDSTSAPTSGGFTLSGMARASGGSGLLTDLIIISSGDKAYVGSIFIFDQAATNINDNSGFSVSDTELKNLVGVVPFVLSSVGGGLNAYYHAQNLNFAYTCVGSANLRFLIKNHGTITPLSGEEFTIRAKAVWAD